MKSNSRRCFIRGITLGSLGTLGLKSYAVSGTSSKRNHYEENLPIINEVDICVLGGSCTGVFAAVRAARLGARVAIVEKQNAFGGVATSALVNRWHPLLDTEFSKQIIAGLTVEVIDRLSLIDAVIKVSNNPTRAFDFNSQELKIELDELVLESGIIPYLHTLFSEPYIDKEGTLTGVIVDNKSGRGVIKAKYFIDATGDGDLCERMGLKSYTIDYLQPPTTTAHFDGWDSGQFNSLLKEHGKEFDIPDTFVWGAPVPSTSSYMLSGTRVHGVNCAIADDLTKAEIEGRRQIRAFMDMIRKYGQDFNVGLTGLPSYIGIRETRHIECLYQVSDDDALYGKKFDDAIANGSYPFDRHLQGGAGIIWKYLDGTQRYTRPGYPAERSRWREETTTNPTFYQVPLRSLIPKQSDNIIVAGRMLDVSMIAFSGIRVMVNMNQLGEAAGVTSYLALNQNSSIRDVDSKQVRIELAKGGSIII